MHLAWSNAGGQITQEKHGALARGIQCMVNKSFNFDMEPEFRLSRYAIQKRDKEVMLGVKFWFYDDDDHHGEEESHFQDAMIDIAHELGLPLAHALGGDISFPHHSEGFIRTYYGSFEIYHSQHDPDYDQYIATSRFNLIKRFPHPPFCVSISHSVQYSDKPAMVCQNDADFTDYEKDKSSRRIKKDKCLASFFSEENYTSNKDSQSLNASTCMSKKVIHVYIGITLLLSFWYGCDILLSIAH